MSLIIELIVGGLIGWLAGIIIGRDVPGGILGNIIAGIAGAWLGGLILGNFGPSLAGFYIVPALLGAIVIILFLVLIARAVNKGK